MNGKVWLVGAGPSDVELLTLKAKRVIEQADVIVYDRLVGYGVLSIIPNDIELIDVGKEAGNHIVVQDKINEILLTEAKKGKNVVRLKGGDPFLFGRGGEELELLAENEIPYEIVPGITSALAVPAYNGIPITHRDYCSSVHIITGHRQKGEKYDIDFNTLAKLNGTLIFLMGVSALNIICNGLLKAGIKENTPAAVLQKGTTAKQKCILATIGTLEAEVLRVGVETPAIIIIGEVCNLSKKFQWYEKLPLFGKRIVVTRPKELNLSITTKLRERGAEVLEMPAICIIPIAENKELYQAFANLDSYNWIVFTSIIGVQVFFEAMKQYKIDIRKLGHTKIAAIGKGTSDSLLDRGIYVDLMPEIYDIESLGKALAEVCNENSKVLIPRAKNGNPKLIEEIIKKRKLEVHNIPIYDTIYQCNKAIDKKSEFEKGNIDFIIFTSSSTVKGFVEATKGLDYTKVKAICIGKQTKAIADSYKMITYMSDEATIDSIITLISKLCEDERKYKSEYGF